MTHVDEYVRVRRCLDLPESSFAESEGAVIFGAGAGEKRTP